uniref:Uncharacterized protein n=1 Tax=Ditylenchus dipsaci TaxID=166011 RepID=A0A915EQH9_9BILA
MQDGLHEGPSLEEEKHVALSKNGNSKPSIMQDDRLLMPPPTKLPMRPLVMKASSEDKDTRTSAGPPGSEVGPRSMSYAMTLKTPLISPTSQQPTGLLFSGSAGEGDTTTTHTNHNNKERTEISGPLNRIFRWRVSSWPVFQ